MRDFFCEAKSMLPPREVIAEGAMLLRGKALPFETDVLAALQTITTQAPFRHMTNRAASSCRWR
jgi:DNA oxidative demethylase